MLRDFWEEFSCIATNFRYLIDMLQGRIKIVDKYPALCIIHLSRLPQLR